MRAIGLSGAAIRRQGMSALPEPEDCVIREQGSLLQKAGRPHGGLLQNLCQAQGQDD